MFSTNLFINVINKRQNRKNKIETFIFGISFGITLLFISCFRLITDMNKNNDIFYFIILFCSFIIFFLLLFLPNILNKVRNGFVYVLKFLFGILLKILLIFFYIIWFIPATLINNFRKETYDSTFVDKKDEVIKISKRNIFSQISNIFSYFIFDGSWYLIPILIVFIIIGLILFFAQSPAVLPFIYPLI